MVIDAWLHIFNEEGVSTITQLDLSQQSAASCQDRQLVRYIIRGSFHNFLGFIFSHAPYRCSNRQVINRSKTLKAMLYPSGSFLLGVKSRRYVTCLPLPLAGGGLGRGLIPQLPDHQVPNYLLSLLLCYNNFNNNQSQY